MKRIVTVQDISCIGKCSLSAALPIISAMGIETAVLPTAVLSAHTAFDGFTFRDLTEDIPKISDHWASERFTFDAIYTGYLGSIHQLELMSAFFDRFKTDKNFILVDPAMADNGKMYSGFTDKFAAHMAKFCAKADIIVPNMTETSFLLDVPYVKSGYDENYVRDLLKGLTGLGAKTAVITDVAFEPDTLGVMAYDTASDSYFCYSKPRIPKKCHGTGDIFASCLVGTLVSGHSLTDALQISVDYTVACIKRSLEDPDAVWYGVNFEAEIPYLLRRCGLI